MRIALLLASLLFSSVAYAGTTQVEAENYATMVGIQKETTADTGGGLSLGYMDAGDSISYYAMIPADGMYTFAVRVSGTDGLGQLAMSVEGEDKFKFNVPNTGGWQNWTTVTSAPVALTAGNRNIRFGVVSRSVNFNWWSYSDGVATSAVSSSAQPSSSSASSQASVIIASSSKSRVSVSSAVSSVVSSSTASSKSSTSSGAAYTITNPILLMWAPPTERENGTPLPIEELCCYDIRGVDANNYGIWTVTINDGRATSYLFTLPDGLLSQVKGFDIAVSDTTGLYSNRVALTPKSGNASSASSSAQSSPPVLSSSSAASSSPVIVSSSSTASSVVSSKSSSSRKYIAAPTEGSIE